MFAQARQIEECIGAALAFVLPLSCVGDQCCRSCCVVARLWGGVQSGRLPSDGQVQVDAIQQWPGQFVAVALDHVR